MKVIRSGLIWLLFFPVGIWAQSYHIYRPVADLSVEEKSPLLWRTYAQVQLFSGVSYGRIQDTEGRTISQMLYGMGGRAFLYVTENMALGISGEKTVSADMQTDRISRIKRQEGSLLAKMILTPQTEPKLYVIGGIGQAQYRTRFALRPNSLRMSTSVFLLGAGVDVGIWKALHLSGEYQLHYDRQRWENFVLRGPRVRQGVSVLVSGQF